MVFNLTSYCPQTGSFPDLFSCCSSLSANYELVEGVDLRFRLFLDTDYDKITNKTKFWADTQVVLATAFVLDPFPAFNVTDSALFISDIYTQDRWESDLTAGKSSMGTMLMPLYL